MWNGGGRVELIASIRKNNEGLARVLKERPAFRQMEKVELVPGFRQLHYQNHLAFCPNHAAMVQHAFPHRDRIRELLPEAPGTSLEVILGGRPTRISFTATHLADVRVLLDLDTLEPCTSEE